MKAIQVTEPNGSLELVEAEIPKAGPGQVLLKVEACGVCHGDSMALGGMASEYPRIPGHEIVGRVVEQGEGTSTETGARVGIGWHGGNGTVTGLTQDGGYAEYAVAYESALVSIPEGIESAQAAPLLCAGQTVFSALKDSSAKPGDLVAVLGIGGLGHLAVQYAHKCGFEVAAISRGAGKRKLALELGANHYIDNADGTAAEQLKELGGAQVVICTSPNPNAIKPLIGGLRPGGEVILAATSMDPIGWSTMDFIGGVASVKGTFTDGSKLAETLKFSSLFDVMPMVETFPLERAAEAYEKMMSAKTLFRSVLVNE